MRKLLVLSSLLYGLCVPYQSIAGEGGGLNPNLDTPNASSEDAKENTQENVPQKIVVQMMLLSASKPNGTVGPMGTITIEETPNGLKFTPNLKGISQGERGLHIHQQPSCDVLIINGAVVPGGKAGGSFNPQRPDKQQEITERNNPDAALPSLTFDSSNESHSPVYARHLKLKDLINHSLVIHAGVDNFSDVPLELAGPGTRLGCGVVTK